MPHSVDIYILYVYAQSSCTYVSRFYKMSRNPFAPVTPYEFSCIPALPSVNTYKHIYIHTYIDVYIYVYIYIYVSSSSLTKGPMPVGARCRSRYSTPFLFLQSSVV